MRSGRGWSKALFWGLENRRPQGLAGSSPVPSAISLNNLVLAIRSHLFRSSRGFARSWRAAGARVANRKGHTMSKLNRLKEKKIRLIATQYGTGAGRGCVKTQKLRTAGIRHP